MGLAIVTFVGTVLTALFGYVKNLAPDNPSFILKVAPFLLAVLLTGAVLKLRRDVSET
jgi:hypothetical protein